MTTPTNGPEQTTAMENPHHFLVPDKSMNQRPEKRNLEQCKTIAQVRAISETWLRMKRANNNNPRIAISDDKLLEETYARFQESAFNARFYDQDQIDSKFPAMFARELEQCVDNKIKRLCDSRGKRYAECELSGYDVQNNEEKKQAVNKLKTYVANANENLKDGNGVIIFGPRGTGKDHLAMGLAKEVIRSQFCDVRWINGLDIYGMFRESFGNGSSKSESDIITELSSPDVLYISDPLPPSGALTEFQMGALFRVLDTRYSQCKATWVTINVEERSEMDSRIGAQNGDRLRDGSLAVYCNWPSYRKVKA